MSIDQPLEFIPWCSCADGLLFNVVLLQPFLLRGEPAWLSQGWGVWIWGVLKRTNTSGTLLPSTPGHVVASFNVISPTLLYCESSIIIPILQVGKQGRVEGLRSRGLGCAPAAAPPSLHEAQASTEPSAHFQPQEKKTALVLSSWVASFRLFTG